MRKRSQRLWLIGAASVLAIGAVALAATALQSTVAFFYSPTAALEKQETIQGRSVRVGGLVEEKSVTHDSAGLLHFRITDNQHTVPVVFDKVPPDLFAECQGVVAEGRFDAQGRLVADRILAKHDENYMPAEVYEAMKKSAEAGGTMPGCAKAPVT